MDEDQVWTIIASAPQAGDDPERQLAAVRAELQQLPTQEVRDFHLIFDERMGDAYTWDLWGAAYLINGGCSDDGFAYFRAWLISRGREVFEAAVRNPDSLAGQVDVDRDDYEFEDLWNVALEVNEELTGQEMPAGGTQWRPIKPRGRRWDFEDDEQIARRLPELARMYGREA